MQITQLPDLTELDIRADHSIIFDAHNRNRAQLITRWRGTIIEQTADWIVITAWQKSIYHFGGLDREVPILVTIMVKPDGRIQSVIIDDRSCGSQGKRCDFPCLEKLTGSLLTGTDIYELQRIVSTAGDVKCLHLYEILAGAASFYGTLPADDKNGVEHELLFITPDKNGLTAENVHEICGKRDSMVFRLDHITPPVMNNENLCSAADAAVRLQYNSEDAGTEMVNGDSFELVFASLNRLFSKSQILEKKYFGQKGRIKFSNYPSMAGLFLLSFSHGAMKGGPGKAFKIEKILHYLQTGYHKQPCKGFGG